MANLEPGPHSFDAATMRAWSRLGVLLLAILVAIVGLMVFKPGT
jgi:hypothetical protein